MNPYSSTDHAAAAARVDQLRSNLTAINAASRVALHNTANTANIINTTGAATGQAPMAPRYNPTGYNYGGRYFPTNKYWMDNRQGERSGVSGYLPTQGYSGMNAYGNSPISIAPKPGMVGDRCPTTATKTHRNNTDLRDLTGSTIDAVRAKAGYNLAVVAASTENAIAAADYRIAMASNEKKNFMTEFNALNRAHQDERDAICAGGNVSKAAQKGYDHAVAMSRTSASIMDLDVKLMYERENREHLKQQLKSVDRRGKEHGEAFLLGKAAVARSQQIESNSEKETDVAGTHGPSPPKKPKPNPQPQPQPQPSIPNATPTTYMPPTNAPAYKSTPKSYMPPANVLPSKPTLAPYVLPTNVPANARTSKSTPNPYVLPTNCGPQPQSNPEPKSPPRPGFISQDLNYYSTLANENIAQISAKLGLAEWWHLLSVVQNVKRYGNFHVSTTFQAGTLIRVPVKMCNISKLAKLADRPMLNINKRQEETKKGEPKKEKTIEEEIKEEMAKNGGRKKEKTIEEEMKEKMAEKAKKAKKAKEKKKIKKKDEEKKEDSEEDSDDETIDLSTCAKCGVIETPKDKDPMLLCDGCDAAYHMACTGLSAVPDEDWLCGVCLDTLAARKKRYHGKEEDKKQLDMRAELPMLPELPLDVVVTAANAVQSLQSYIGARKKKALAKLEESQKMANEDMAKSIASSSAEDQYLKAQCEKERVEFERKEDAFVQENGQKGKETKAWLDRRRIMSGLASLKNPNDSKRSSLDGNKDNTQTLRLDLQSLRWPLTLVEKKILAKQNQLKNLQRQKHQQEKTHRLEKESILEEFAALLNEPKLPFESKKAFLDREPRPSFLGFYLPETTLGVRVLQTLQKPTELIMAVPIKSNTPVSSKDKVLLVEEEDEERILVGRDYAIFGRAALFSSQRDDELPLDFSEASVRWAQKLLAIELRKDIRNMAGRVTEVVIPDSVRVRAFTSTSASTMKSTCTSTSTLKSKPLSTPESATTSFISNDSLRDLICSCNRLIDTPSSPTPTLLSNNGLILRDYQKASLRWMLDKERDPTGLGVAGEFWSRMRFLDGQGDYYYCELTGSFTRDIYDFRSDVGQNDAAANNGGLPVGGILGEEMGLGKTVICIALVVANPPLKHNRMLPREHLATIKHPSYTMPPFVSHSSKVIREYILSNGTLVIAPTTLCSQWESEVEKFAPSMSVLTITSDVRTDAKEIASSDIVIVSATILHITSRIQRLIKKIHFHRIFLDELHYKHTGLKIRDTLAALSSTYRYCVTGSPIGDSLDDLHAQFRFLRIPQFCRKDFWKKNITNPYCKKSYDSFRILRSLLSHLLIRHTKEQMVEDGKLIPALPARTVETVLLSFGSDAERKVYEEVEARNMKRFMELRKVSQQTVLSRYTELIGILYVARQACVHTCLINLNFMQHPNLPRKDEKAPNSNTTDETNHTTPKQDDLSIKRANILELAVEKVRPSAQGRIRETVLRLQEGSMKLMQCHVCMEPIEVEDIVLTPCAHMFCAECIMNALNVVSNTREAIGWCPDCREKLIKSEITFIGNAEEANSRMVSFKKEKRKSVGTEIDESHSVAKNVRILATESNTRRVSCRKEKRQKLCIHDHTLSQEFLNSHREASLYIGTKTSHLLEEIKLMMKKDQKSKCVVISQFLSVLNIIAEEMTVRDIGFVRVDGNMKQQQRIDALLDFSSEPNICVLLLSMRAGAAGLNLVAADHCFILDAPMISDVEEQAIQQIHRNGQTRPVIVKRFIIKNSIEERILSSRRDLNANHSLLRTQMDRGRLSASEKNLLDRPSKRVCLEGSNAMVDHSYQRMNLLETLFGCSTVVRDTEG